MALMNMPPTIGAPHAAMSTTMFGRPMSVSPTATVPESETSTPMMAPTEISMFPVMMIIEMPIAATAM